MKKFPRHGSNVTFSTNVVLVLARTQVQLVANTDTSAVSIFSPWRGINYMLSWKPAEALSSYSVGKKFGLVTVKVDKTYVA
jgi:hypothetical protein